jgi:hypothetical protein
MTMKQLNLFKSENERTEDKVKQQKMITRIYLILLTGMIMFSRHHSVFSQNKVPKTGILI